MRLPFLFMSSLSLIACSEELESISYGELSAAWQILPSGCEEAGIETISIRFEGTSIDGANPKSELFPCTSLSAQVSEIPVGFYDIYFNGIDGSGKSRYQSSHENILVHPDNTFTLETQLHAAQGSIRTQWSFENGQLCGTNGVKDIDVSIFDAHDYLIKDSVFSCTEGFADMGGLKAGEYLIVGFAKGREGQKYRGKSEIILNQGDDISVNVSLETM